MINDVDESLRALIRRDVLNGANVDIAFEAPTKEWSARRNAPALNLYLYEIREDLERRQVQYEEIRDDRGIVVERRLPPRKFKLSYLLTAWTQRPDDEHRLLSSALSCFLQFDALPDDILQGELAAQPYPVRVTVGLPLPPERSVSDVWTALGGELKPSLDVVLTVPFQTGRHQQPVGPPVLEEPRISIAAVPDRPRAKPHEGKDGEDEAPASGKRSGKKARGAAGGASTGDQPGGAGTPPADEAEQVPLASEVRLGGKGPEGRILRIRTLPRP